MKLLALAFSGVLLTQAAASAAWRQTTKGSINGVVLRVGTGQAVSSARVLLTRQGGGQAAVAPIPAGVTDAKGMFAFPSLDEGAYSIRVEANGYVAQNHGQRFAGGPGTPIRLTVGQEVKDVAISLTPAGNISGRIRDTFDQPVVNIPVRLLRYSYNVSGQRTYESAGSVQTNDRGEYRIYWVTPGRYFLMAGRPSSGADALLGMIDQTIGGGANGNEVPVYPGCAFYPGVADIASARAIEIQPGLDLAAIDLTLPSKPRAYKIRGRVVDSRTGQPPPNANITLSMRTPGLDALNNGFNGGAIHHYNAATGDIEIRDVLPGDYLLTAMVQGQASMSTSRDGPLRSGEATGKAVAVVSDSDVDGIVVTVAPSASIPGRVDGQLPSGSTFDRLSVQLVSVNSPTPMPYINFKPDSAPKPDGTFQLTGIAAGEYLLRVLARAGGGNALINPLGGGGNIYLKEARFEGLDILNAPLHFSGSVSGTLDIVIGVSGGQVSGVVADGRSQPVAVTQVVLVPDRVRDRTDLYRVTTTDENGRFTFSGMAPGDYKVFSWEGLEPYAYFDPDLLARSESRGRAVHVTESSQETIEVKIIPAGGAQ